MINTVLVDHPEGYGNEQVPGFRLIIQLKSPSWAHSFLGSCLEARDWRDSFLLFVSAGVVPLQYQKPWLVENVGGLCYALVGVHPDSSKFTIVHRETLGN